MTLTTLSIKHFGITTPNLSLLKQQVSASRTEILFLEKPFIRTAKELNTSIFNSSSKALADFLEQEKEYDSIF